MFIMIQNEKIEMSFAHATRYCNPCIEKNMCLKHGTLLFYETFMRKIKILAFFEFPKCCSILLTDPEYVQGDEERNALTRRTVIHKPIYH